MGDSLAARSRSVQMPACVVWLHVRSRLTHDMCQRGATIAIHCARFDQTELASENLPTPDCTSNCALHPKDLSQTVQIKRTKSSQQDLLPRSTLAQAPSDSGVRHRIDTLAPPPNNALMPKPETVRRIKSYSAPTGFVYQYQFQDVRPAPPGPIPGNEYIYYVSADRKTMFPVRIFVSRDALQHWSKQTGRVLTGTEEYAVAKMRLFQAFDEVENFAKSRPMLAVDESNLGALLERLDL